MGYLTVQDAYEHLVDVFDLDGKNVAKVDRILRRAVASAHRRLTDMHKWQWLRRETTVYTSNHYTTGTIAYTASTRQVTLSGGTWPTDAEFGSLIIGSLRYDIERRVSDTVVEIAARNAPTADIAASTTYQWIRFQYLLPVDFGDVTAVIDPQSLSHMSRYSPQELFDCRDSIPSASYPSGWAIQPSVQRPGRTEILFTSIAAASQPIRIQYLARTGNPAFTELSTGTVAVTGDAATFSGSILSEACVGAVLRVAPSTTKPTSPYGVWIDNDTGTRTVVPTYEQIVSEVSSATVAVLDSAVSSDVTGKAFTLSPRVDVEPAAMWDAYLALAEFEYCDLSRADERVRNAANLRFQQRLREAIIADSRHIKLDEYNTSRTVVFRPTIDE